MTKSAEEYTDEISDTIAFLIARERRDVEAAMAIIGDDAMKINHMLLSMADFAAAMVKIPAAMAGVTTEKFLETMALTAKGQLPDIVKKYM